MQFKFKTLDTTHEHFLLVLLVIAIVFFAFFTFIQIQHPMVGETDAFCRSEHAITALNNNNFFEPLYTGIWLVGNRFFMQMLLLFSETTTQYRFLYSMSLVALIPAIYLYSHSLFTIKKVSLTSGILLITLPLVLFLSTQTLTELPFTIPFIFSLYFLFKSKPNYAASIIALNIAHSFRFESWFILPLIFAYLVSENSLSHFKKALYIILYSFFPIFWILFGYYTTGVWYDFFLDKYTHASEKNFDHTYGNIFISTHRWLVSLAVSVPHTFPPLWIIGVTFSIFNIRKKILFSALIPLYLFIVLILQVYLGTMEWQPTRYLAPIIILSLPFISYALVHIIQIFKSYKLFLIALFLIICLDYHRNVGLVHHNLIEKWEYLPVLSQDISTFLNGRNAYFLENITYSDTSLDCFITFYNLSNTVTINYISESFFDSIDSKTYENELVILPKNHISFFEDSNSIQTLEIMHRNTGFFVVMYTLKER